MKSKPLYHSISLLLSLSLAAMLLLALLPLSLEYTALKDFGALSDKLEEFSVYYDLLEEVDRNVGMYVNSASEETYLEIMEGMRAVRESDEALSEAFGEAGFADNHQITGLYLEKVEMLLNLSPDEMWQSKLSALRECRRVYKYLKDNERVRSVLFSEAYSEQVRRWRMQFYAVLALVLLFSLALLLTAVRMSGRLLRPLRVLTDRIRHYKPGHGQVSLEEVPGTEETRILSEAFRELSRQLEEKLESDERLHALEVENLQMQVTLSETRSQLLQSMISPHFLFNCLGTLAGLAYFEKAPRTRKMSLLVSSYLRTSLSLIGQNVSLEKELDHTRQYLEIQKVRFQDQLEYKVIADGDLSRVHVPAMILQPLCENAISHGIKDRLEGALVEIRAEVGDGEAVLSVRDNGKGMGRDALERLRGEISKPFEAGSQHIGLHSVCSRLRDSGTLELESVEGEGFLARIRLPRMGGEGL